MKNLINQSINRLSSSAQGVLLALISTLLFVLVGVLVKTLSSSIDVFQILLFRQLIFITLLIPAMITSIDVLLKPRFISLHFLRITAAFIALYCGFITLGNIPLADATALGFTQVLFVAGISKYFLNESITWMRIITIGIGFIGVMLVVRPTFDDTSLIYTLTGLAAAIGAAVAVVCVRSIAKTEPKIVLLAYQAIFVGLLALLPSFLTWQWPNTYELILLVCVGVVSSIAQWVGITSYKYGEANVISNVEYAKMLYSIMFGYWIFTEVPDTLAIVGALIIIASAFIPLLANRFAKHAK